MMRYVLAVLVTLWMAPGIAGQCYQVSCGQGDVSGGQGQWQYGWLVGATIPGGYGS